MNNVIKRRHTIQYAQIHNNPLQNDLVDLRAIGLLSHLMSLPSDWIIYKTQLYKKFSRKNIDAAWKELANKNYIIGFNCYVNGKNNLFIMYLIFHLNLRNLWNLSKVLLQN
ncbi:hypothetical protein Y693_28490 (plasmid) [Bacillus anthracis str. 95014]|nr:hypothetical protein Y693_28490 [Bacillus anthracis str. 95014]